MKQTTQKANKQRFGVVGFFNIVIENIENGFDSVQTMNKAAKPGNALRNDGEG